MKKNMKRIILVVIFVLISFLLFYNKYEERVLDDEFEVLTKKDLEKDNFNTKIKTKFSYAKVEKAIKEYLTDYSTNLKNLNDLLKDENLKSILSADNYQKDGKAFTNSKVYLTTYRDNFDKSMNALLELSEDKKIMSYIENKKVSKYYVKLYRELMLGDNMKKELKSSKKYLENANNNVNNLLGAYESTLNFLSSSSSWTVRNGQIIFTNQNDLNTYNSLISSIK